MSRRKNLSEALAIIEGEGLAIIAVIPGVHHKVVVERNGCRRKIIVATSESDPRRTKNFRMDVRKIAAAMASA